MGVRALFAVLSLLSLASLGGCSKDEAQKVQPETRGKRGENCESRNECESGLACLNHICSKNEFDIAVEAKHCDRIECTTTKDCCGERKTTAPAACSGRVSICNTPTFPGCVQTTCTSALGCAGGGTCPKGVCQGSGQSGAACEVAADCPVVANTCVIAEGSTSGSCSYSGALCSDVTPCAALPASCSTRVCNCQNPEYSPSDPICTDPDCEDVCTLTCENELCVTNHSCETNTDCVTPGLSQCRSDGRCVQCLEDEDCVDDQQTCVEGSCRKPCEHNEECPLFEECNTKSGKCEYVGCRSDRECVLAASRPSVDPENPSPSAAEDPRLLKCLPSTADPQVMTCKIPCENDGSCGAQSVCDEGYCRFIGCKDDEECRGYLGLTDQKPTPQKPFVTTAVCRE